VRQLSIACAIAIALGGTAHADGTGVIAASAPGGDRAAVAKEWPGWWDEILVWCRTDIPFDDPMERLRSVPVAGTSPALADRPALRVAVDALIERSSRYRTAIGLPNVPPSNVVGEVVRDLERELGRRSKPFQLVITEVRVREPLWEPLTATHILASERFVESDAVRPALREVLLPLA